MIQPKLNFDFKGEISICLNISLSDQRGGKYWHNPIGHLGIVKGDN